MPAYNEEEALPLTVEEYIGYVDEVIIVNDGSKDGTDRIAKECAAKYGKVKYIKHDTNKGKPEALRTGIRNATGNIVIWTDVDCTYPAKYIPVFIEKINKGTDLVLGSRIYNRSNMPLFNVVGNTIFSGLMTYFCYTKIVDAQTGYRAMRKELFPILDVKAINLEHESKMTMRAAKLGYKIAEVPVEYRKRVGRSKLNPLKDGYQMLKNIPSIVWGESTLLLKSVIVVNLILFAIGLGFGLFSVYLKLTTGGLSHEYYPLLAVVFVLVAIQLMSFALIMEFIVNKLNKIEDMLWKNSER